MNFPEGHLRDPAGFTLIELVTVLIIVGIVSIFAASRFVNRTAFDEFGFFQASLSAVRYAQKIAMASGCDIRVTFDATGVTLRQWIDTGNNSCDFASPGAVLTALPRPGGGNFTTTAPAGVAVSGTDFFYDQTGIPRTLAGAVIAVETTTTIGGRTLSVAPQTGFARCTAGC